MKYCDIPGTRFTEILYIFVCLIFRSVDKFLTESSLDINSILPCKGIGVLHLAVGVEPPEKSKECTEILLKYGGDPNLR